MRWSNDAKDHLPHKRCCHLGLRQLLKTMLNPSTEAASLASQPAVLHSYSEYLYWLDAQLGKFTTSTLSGVSSGVGIDTAPGDVHRLARHSDAASGGRMTSANTAMAAPKEPGTHFALLPQLPTCVVVSPGQVSVGAHPQDVDAQPCEYPPQRVQLNKAFAISLTPVTFEQWDACRADDGTRHHPGDAGWGRGNRPVLNVNWYDAEEYCAWLSRLTGLRWRLPTEAEWMYTFWAGRPAHDRYPWGADLGFRQLRHHAWFTDNANLRTQPVGQLQANPWGMVDMLGNVAEWVADAWQPDLTNLPADGGPMPGHPRHAGRVIKGGSWLESARTLRPSTRDHFPPDHRSYRVGFRVLLELP